MRWLEPLIRAFLPLVPTVAIAAPPRVWPVQRDAEHSVYIDVTGKVRIPGPFAVADVFAEGLARASIDGETFGFIDQRGAWRIVPHFEDARAFHDGLAAVALRTDDELDVGTPPWGFVAATGVIVIPCSFGSVLDFSEGLAPFAGRADGSKWGFVGRDGRIAIGPQFESAGVFSAGLAPVVTRDGDGKARGGFIDHTGRFVIAPTFQMLQGFTEDLAAASQDGKMCGYLDKTGAWAITPRFSRCGAFQEGKAVVQLADGFAYIDAQGQIVIAGPYVSAQPFCEGLAFVEPKGLYGFYVEPTGAPFLATIHAQNRRSGEIVLVTAAAFDGGLAAVSIRDAKQKKGGDPAWINRQGQIVWQPIPPAQGKASTAAKP